MSAYQHNFKDMEGQTINGIKVVSISHVNNKGLVVWNVICRCGKPYITCGSHIRRGRTSCGCGRRHSYKKVEPNNQLSYLKSKIKVTRYGVPSIAILKHNYG